MFSAFEFLFRLVIKKREWACRRRSISGITVSLRVELARRARLRRSFNFRPSVAKHESSANFVFSLFLRRKLSLNPDIIQWSRERASSMLNYTTLLLLSLDVFMPLLFFFVSPGVVQSGQLRNLVRVSSTYGLCCTYGGENPPTFISHSGGATFPRTLTPWTR